MEVGQELRLLLGVASYGELIWRVLKGMSCCATTWCSFVPAAYVAYVANQVEFCGIFAQSKECPAPCQIFPEHARVRMWARSYYGLGQKLESRDS